MWIFNTDTKMWVKQSDTLDINSYNNVKQDLSKTALYSKALSGAMYLHVENTNDIYQSLKYKDNKSWFIDIAASNYNAANSLPYDGVPINRNTIGEYQNYNYEYGFTLKNNFTPTKEIDNFNYLKVKVATNDTININSTTISSIDGVKLNNGDLILIKNQINTVDLAFNIDPNNYFVGNYYLLSQNTTDNTYYYFNENNGIYEYNNNSLTKVELFTYSQTSNLNIYVSLGDTNADKQFSLSRKLNGYYPIETEPFEFVEAHNYLLRHQLDYHNLFEANYFDILKHGTQSLNIDGFTYTIPSRTIYIGDFGIILNLQDTTKSQYIYNEFKENLKCITETSNFYWTCGDNGTLLRISKIDFSIENVIKNEGNTFRHISFLNDNNGIIVGDYNTIYYTKNSGYNWDKIIFSDIENYNYNKVLYYSYNIIYLIGKNGVFLELNYSDFTGWSYKKIDIFKNLTLTDRYELIEDINDLYFTNFTNWNLTYSVNVNQSAGLGITYSMDCLFMVTNNSNIIVYEVNKFITEHQCLYLSFSQSIGDITNIYRKIGTNDIVIAGDNIIEFDINTFKYVSPTSNLIESTGNYSILLNKKVNNIRDYDGTEILGVGNFALSFNYDYFFGNYTTISNVDIIPKMLFLDYDMANKLNFFDSDYNYRLPNNITFSFSNIKSIDFNSEQYTWIDYMKDSYKTYGVNSDTSTGNYVNLNTKFEDGIVSYNFNGGDVTLDINEIKYLYPNLLSPTSSRYKQFIPTLPSSTYSIFLNKYMSIFKLPSTFCNVGDIISISSDSVNADLVVNYGVTTSSPGGSIRYSVISSGGTGYNVNDTFYIDNGSNYATGKILAVSSGGNGTITAATISNTITYGWVVGNTFSIIGGVTQSIGIVDAVDTIYYFRYNGIQNGGSGYNIGDTFTITSPSNTGYIGVVTAVSSGSVTAISYNANGYSTTLPPVITSTSNITGNGIGLILNGYLSGSLVGVPKSITILSGGSGYSIGNIYNTSQNSIGIVMNIQVLNVNSPYLPPGIVTSYELTYDGLGYTPGIQTTTNMTASGSGLKINILSATPLVLYDTYFYAFNDFNQAMLNSIKNSSNIAIRNLNKFDTVQDLYDNFHNHPLSDGFDLQYENDNITISPKFNNITSYRSLETNVVTSYYITPTYSTYTYYYTSITGSNPTLLATMSLLPSEDDSAVLNFNGDIYTFTFKNTPNNTNEVMIGSDINLTLNNLNYAILSSSASVYLNYSTIVIGNQLKLVFSNSMLLGPNYNLVFNLSSQYNSTSIFDNKMLYTNTYYQFGYTPNYNLLGYLNNINSGFTYSKKFYSMPEYSNIPCNAGGNFTPDNIYYDSNQNTTFLRNKLIFGNNLKFEYDTLWVNTFVDISMNTSSGILNKERVLIIDKYYDKDYNGWAVIFEDSLIHINGFNYYNILLYSINIISRNTLKLISEDLEVFNNINKPMTSKYMNNSTWYYSYYDNPIKTKVNTDSYAKIILSDGDIKKYITSIMFTDFNNNLVMSIINVNKTHNIKINNSYDINSNLALNTEYLYDLNDITQAYLEFNGGTYSSEILNPNYFGIHTINKIDSYNVLVNEKYLNLTSANDTGYIKYNIFDPFLNYNPINLLDIGDDGMYKIPIKLSQDNVYNTGTTYSIVNYSNNPKNFRLVDGLDINTLSQKYHWILEAEISDAIIGMDSDGIVWYKGIWHSGRWFGGKWLSGTWYSGDWYSGDWYSYEIIDNINTIIIGKKNVNINNSIWYDGRWYNGIWHSGIWENGRWYDGTWLYGKWYNGIWNDGVWNDGMFFGGIWVRGTWYSGLFNSSNKPSYWIDGSFNSGEFQNGMWYNGIFGLSYSAINKFGSSASNSRNATWQGGVWASGDFYSNQEFNADGTTKPSIVHKYAIWKTGTWNQGNFYGGIAYDIQFNNGTWYNGITQDIEIIGIYASYSQITLNGIFRYNIGDYVNIINNGMTSSYYNIGNDDNPGIYRVANSTFDLNNNFTTLTLDYNFSNILNNTLLNNEISNVDTGLRIVSKFKNIIWKSGIWNNGIFDGGLYLGGIWYKGVFLSGTWGV